MIYRRWGIDLIVGMIGNILNAGEDLEWELIKMARDNLVDRNHMIEATVVNSMWIIVLDKLLELDERLQEIEDGNSKNT